MHPPRTGANHNPTRDTGRPATQMTPDLLLAAGQRAAVTRRGVEADVGPPIERVAAWTERRLVFRGEPLSAVVAEFNRYRLQALIVDDPRLAEIRINGVFDLDDPASLLPICATSSRSRSNDRGDGSEHLARRDASSARLELLIEPEIGDPIRGGRY